MKSVSYILTIAGLDPSSGAGITSDIKTFEAHNLYGLSVCTAVTVQNDISFKECIWIEKNSILNQIEILFDRFSIAVVKIGIVQSWEVLLAVLQTLRNRNPTVKIVLDPVLKASAGFVFHHTEDFVVFEKVLFLCDFITPNYEEIKELFPEKTIEETLEFIAQRTNIYLKGGHNFAKKGWDELYHSKIVKFNIPPIAKSIFDKHGSGCVLSAALAANLALENSLENACMKAKSYTEQFLNSNSSLLGTHKYN
ncbi:MULTISPECIES: bifunctional hydroxymethylpyrimidine kinase/phosphomethylpyrimidine kinase [unclassified Polaribacter]|uniref:bifunctional hydroxymethylpyrimidine kinase/phosphomethylpyrimidine kinase n=1 Tax=unclassified Polaribacter TaxID=196858 RepID=UPI0011BED2DC|nr:MULTISPECIES: bifunctional hydroxymethylpyrimidine kinase/phosphomethylpyrimidine kinase [unclassified Polaribacter]TXD52608.1 hydroxymethylpyrimidine/phosphomethylpyrimidine kinase [Polaribacter sp. IC063]TXD61830.1 hydroxymethylpyrimidine/phosphomethylpyrimidine kinase [Polaribacter sp. IC066]